MYFQDLILTLQKYWNDNGCLLTQPYDVEKGAGTFNPTTFFRSLGPEPFAAAYAEPCRRPTDGRYGENPIRMQHYYQFQVILKPNPANIIDLYLGSLRAIGVHPEDHDIRFVHDDWETAALGAWGLGWEVWCDGTEVTQFTYFQQVGGFELGAITGEITYGLERLCMFLQGVDNVFDLQYNRSITYGDIFKQNEVQFSKYNFEQAQTSMHFKHFDDFEKECLNLCEAQNPAPALDYAIKASHCFNILDARGAISVNERQGYVMRIRKLAKQVAGAWLENRKTLNYPLLKLASQTKAAPSAPKQKFQRGTQKRGSLLIELGVEEMPAKVFPGLMNDLPKIWNKIIEPYQLTPGETNFYYTPRRIAIQVNELDLFQEDKSLSLKGPPANIAKDQKGNWTKAALGFAKKNGLSESDLTIKEFDGNEYIFAEVIQKGKHCSEILQQAVPQVFAKISWYKTMRWGLGKGTPFVRPIQWLTILLNNNIVPLEFAGVTSRGTSQGHRFLSNKEIKVTSRTYVEDLKKVNVYVDQNERREKIKQEIQKAVQKQNLYWRPDEALLSEVNFLIEYPVIVHGNFDAKYLDLPEEVIVSEMREHQKYLALVDASGKLHHSFIAVSNMQCNDMSLVKSGYENVLISRLFDGNFFLNEDLKVNLKDRVKALQKVTFEESLGSVYDKVERIKKLALWAAKNAKQELDSKSTLQIENIAMLCKADLTTAMVFEFPDLQGEMGRFYASKQGLDEVVSDGIRDHYIPLGGYETVNISFEAACVGLADRIDSITGLFSVGKIPTGSADPFAIRRACLGTILILRALKINIPIDAFITQSIELYGSHISEDDRENLKKKILDFYLQRLKKLLQESGRSNIDVGGVSADTIDSVVKARQSWFDISEFIDRVSAMHTFRNTEQFENVAATFKRVNNILKTNIPGEAQVDLYTETTENQLHESATQLEPLIEKELKEGNYIAALESIATLKGKVDALFEKVMINDPDEKVRHNRQLLIQKIKNQVIKVADFSAIQDS